MFTVYVVVMSEAPKAASKCCNNKGWKRKLSPEPEAHGKEIGGKTPRGSLPVSLFFFWVVCTYIIEEK